MSARRTYQKRFERQTGQRLKRSLDESAPSDIPNEFMELLRKADNRRRKDENRAPTSTDAG